MVSSKTNFDISKLVEGVYETHAFAAAQKGLRFTFSISHKLPGKFHGDLNSIEKALSVIIRMAIEDSVNGSVEVLVDPVSKSDDALIVKFAVYESSKQIPYWFSVSLLPAISKSKTTKSA